MNGSDLDEFATLVSATGGCAADPSDPRYADCTLPILDASASWSASLTFSVPLVPAHLVSYVHLTEGLCVPSGTTWVYQQQEAAMASVSFTVS